MKTATWTALMMGTCLLLSQAHGTLIYEQDFETPSAGAQVHTLTGWSWTGGGFIGRVSTNAAFTGTQGADITRNEVNATAAGISGALARYWVSSGEDSGAAFEAITNGVITVSLAVKAVDWGDTTGSRLNIRANDQTGTGYGVSALTLIEFELRGDGTLVYWNGSGAGSLNTVENVAVDEWNEISYTIDLDQRVNNLYLNGTLVGEDFAFRSSSAVSIFTGIRFMEENDGATTGGVYIDDISIIPEPGTAFLFALGALLFLRRRLLLMTSRCA